MDENHVHVAFWSSSQNQYRQHNAMCTLGNGVKTAVAKMSASPSLRGEPLQPSTDRSNGVRYGNCSPFPAAERPAESDECGIAFAVGESNIGETNARSLTLVFTNLHGAFRTVP